MSTMDTSGTATLTHVTPETDRANHGRWEWVKNVPNLYIDREIHDDRRHGRPGLITASLVIRSSPWTLHHTLLAAAPYDHRLSYRFASRAAIPRFGFLFSHYAIVREETCGITR